MILQLLHIILRYLFFHIYRQDENLQEKSSLSHFYMDVIKIILGKQANIL